MRTCARSLGSPANVVLVEALNRIRERVVWQIAEQPEALAVFGGNLVEAVRAAGFQEWDLEQGHSLTDVIAYCICDESVAQWRVIWIAACAAMGLWLLEVRWFEGL